MADGSLDSDCTRMLYILKILHISFILWLGPFVCALPVLISTIDEGLELLFRQRNSNEAKGIEQASLETRDLAVAFPTHSNVIG